MSQISKQALIVDNNQSFPTNNAGEISPADLRAFNTNMIDSLVNEIPYQSFTASVTNSINLLNQFSASQQPSFTALNSFTASQLTINSGYNTSTQSLNASVSALQSQTSQLTTFTGSINQIQSAGITLGNATRFNFSGLMTASITANVNGNIADIGLVNDNTKVGTASFNAYTASTDSSINNLNQFTSSQISFNTSATASISQLLSFSSSLDATFATDAQLAAVSASLDATKLNTSSFNVYTQSTNNTISGLATTSSFNSYTSSQGSSNTNTNLFTASINSYTASNDTKWTTIGLLTGSYATTGSNSFSGSQRITGSVLGNITALTISSNTASMDLSKGNFFTLTLVSGSSTQLTATNITPGQTINLLITQSTPASGSLTYNSTFKFPSGVSYTQTNLAGAKDILSFITFDNSTIYSTPVNNLV